jgi:hypothetical protein
MTEWNQTPTTVTISIPLPYRIDPKKFDSLITENFVKLNIPEIKFFKFIDLNKEVDIEKSNIVVEDKRIVFYLSKVKEEQWEGLEYKSTSKEELKERRKLAEVNHEKKIKEELENARSRTIEYEKYVVDKSIKLDEDKRKELREKKNVEKEEAEKEIYKYFEELKSKEKEKEIEDAKYKEVKDSRIKEKENNVSNNIRALTENNLKEHISTDKEKENENIKENNVTDNRKALTEINLKDNIPTDKKKVNEKENENNVTDNTKALTEINLKDNIPTDKKKVNEKENNIQNSSKNEIFDEESLNKANKPSTTANTIRQPANIKVNLTEKAIPHFAARESLSKEPPYPKSKKYVPEKNMVKNHFLQIF